MASRTRTTHAPSSPVGAKTPAPEPIVLDPHRAFVFPNRIREHRRRAGLQRLMALSELLPEIPYIRLSKLERGEVVARADELVRIGHALGVEPRDLLVDIDRSGFDMARWSEPFQSAQPWDEEEERFSVMLGAALRVLRNRDRSLTIARLDKEYGLPAVILSRIENAQKPLDRWNEATLAALCRLFGVTDEVQLRETVSASYRRGDLDGYVGTIANPDIRMARTRQRVRELSTELGFSGSTRARKPARPTIAPINTPAPITPPSAQIRQLKVYGTALPGGLIAATATGATVEAPGSAGPKAFGLAVCRATLGAGLPAAAIVVVDPDRVPVAGGLAAIRSVDGYRLVTVTYDRSGTTMGYSVAPDLEINMDELEPDSISAVISAVFP